MPPPTAATPSPNRFLPGNQRRAQSPTKSTRPPPSTLRREIAPPPGESDNSHPPTQFAPTPRFSHGKPKATSQSPGVASPPKPTFAQALRASARPHEDVEDSGGFNGDDEMLDNGQAQAQQNTEYDFSNFVANPPWTNDLALSPKRRRLDGDEALSSPAESILQPPQTPASFLKNQTPRFTTSQAQTYRPSTVPEPGSTQRPTFIRPPQQTQEPIEPLPEAFSPHRRGQKFIPGSMAATVQQWVLETGQAAIQSRRGQGYLRGEDYAMWVKIEGDVEGDGPFVARGRTSNGDRVDLLLAGRNEASGISTTQRMCAGCIVGVREPMWDVELDRRTWTVGVDWRVLS